MQLFINKTLLFAFIHAKYSNYNLALVKLFNGYPVTLSKYEQIIIYTLIWTNGHMGCT